MMFVLAVLVGAALMQSNEAARLNARKMETGMQTMSEDVIKRIIRKGAADVNVSTKFLVLVQERLRHHKRGFKVSKTKETRSLRQAMSKSVAIGDDNSADIQYGSGVKGVVVRMNEMLLETQEKVDMNHLQCTAELREMRASITGKEDAIEQEEVERVQVDTYLQIASGKMNDAKKSWSDAQYLLWEHNDQCWKDNATLNHDIEIVKGDLTVMQNVLDMTKCSSAANYTNTTFMMLMCENKATGRLFQKVQTDSAALHAELGKLKSNKSRAVVDNVVVAKDFKVNKDQTVLLQTGHHHGADEPPIEADLPDDGTDCSIAASPKCPELQKRFMNIHGGIEDALEEYQKMQANLNVHCKTGREDLNSEMKVYWDFFTTESERVGQLTGENQQRATEIKTTSTEVTLEEEKHAQLTKECTGNKQEYENEQCALRKIRGELLQMSSFRAEMEDCVVTEWVEGECSKDCGRGTWAVSREVEMEQGPATDENGTDTEEWEQGVKCPILTAAQPCNIEACPVDCEVSEWQDWSGCTKICGGGERLRTANVLQNAVNGGKECPGLIDREDCNMESCDRDCELSEEWGEWSESCSRACGGGVQTRFKSVVRAAKGEGTCPDFYDPKMFNSRACNENPCLFTKEAVTCSSLVDVSVVLDGSAGVNWAYMKRAAAFLLDEYGADARVEVVVAGSPMSIPEIDDCRGSEVESLEACGMYLLEWNTSTHIKEQLAALTPTNTGTSLLDMGLTIVESSLQYSRSDASKIVVVITGGDPFSMGRLLEAASRLKKLAHISFVLVGHSTHPEHAYQEMCSSYKDYYGWWENWYDMIGPTGMLADYSPFTKLTENVCPQLSWPASAVDPTVQLLTSDFELELRTNASSTTSR